MVGRLEEAQLRVWIQWAKRLQSERGVAEESGQTMKGRAPGHPLPVAPLVVKSQ